MRYVFNICFLLIFDLTFSQEIKSADKHLPIFITKKATDCKDAIPVAITKNTAFNYVNPAKGFGIQEIVSNNKNDKSFEREHNTTWYLLSVKNDGELIFEITPIDSTNDYDFLLYRYTDSTFCNSLLNKKINPVRGNLSISTVKSGAKTGLSSKVLTAFTSKSIGATFSKSITVKRGEQYMLVVDNVTPNGKGYGIAFNCLNEITISGKVTDATQKSINTYITLLDRNNTEIAKTITTHNGKYKITAEVKEDVDYSLLFYSDSCLPVSEIINTNMIDSIMDSLIINKTMLKLKIGETYNLVDFPGIAILLNVEGSPIVGLTQLMKKNPKMRIQIQGHAAKYELTKNSTQTNGGFKIDQTIAEERADAVYWKLLQNGIPKERMEKIGFSSDKPLIVHPTTDAEKSKNKRVSIKILAL